MDILIHESKCGLPRLREAQFWAIKIVAELSRYLR
jgi:hypothetical protein